MPKTSFFRGSNGLPRGRDAPNLMWIILLMTATLDDGPRNPPRSLLVTRGGTGFDFGMAISDFSRGLALWRLWVRLGASAILHAYRGSMRGPMRRTTRTVLLVRASRV